MQNLDKIMRPKSIAVVGASTKEHTIGSDIMKRLQEYEFKGNIYPVNPKGGIIEGILNSADFRCKVSSYFYDGGKTYYIIKFDILSQKILCNMYLSN